MPDMKRSLPAYIGSMTKYVSGAQPSPILQPPKQKLLMKTRKLSAYRRWHGGPPICPFRDKNIVFYDFDATMMADCIY